MSRQPCGEEDAGDSDSLLSQTLLAFLRACLDFQPCTPYMSFVLEHKETLSPRIKLSDTPTFFQVRGVWAAYFTISYAITV